MGSKINPTFYRFREGCIQFFCPLCKDHQSTKIPEKIGWKHHLSLAVFTIVFAAVAWPLFELKGVFFYLLFWAVFEFALRLGKRHALVCRGCGFDPFLYKVDVKLARNALKKHWQGRIEKENLFAGIKLKNYQTTPKEGVPASILEETAPQLDTGEQRP